jgi:hypothetical protein
MVLVFDFLSVEEWGMEDRLMEDRLIANCGLPHSLFPIPYSLFPIPYSLFPIAGN